jgi:hypothetical protein
MLRVLTRALGQGNDVQAHGGVAQVLADPVSRGQIHVVVEESVSCHRVDGQHRELEGVGLVADHDDVVGPYDRLCSPGALVLGRKNDHPFPDELLVRVGSARYHPAHSFGTGGAGHSRHTVEPADCLEEVGRVDGCGFHGDEELAGGKRLVRGVVEADGLGKVADCRENELAHDQSLRTEVIV